MSKTLVFGSNGQLASELRLLRSGDSSYTFMPKEAIDVQNNEQIANLLRSHMPSTVINCTAYTAVDKAETDHEACWALNATFPKTLAALSNSLNFHLIHYSTDYVFDGLGSKPYAESTPTNPMSAYGRSKLEGEQAIQQLSNHASVVRTSWVYSKFGANFVKTMLRLADTDRPLRVINDQRGSPTWARDLASFTVEQLTKSRPSGAEILHFSNEGVTTWYDFAREIMQVWGKSKSVEPIPTSDYPTPAKRPSFGVLSKEKVKTKFHITVPDWRASLRHCRTDWEL